MQVKVGVLIFETCDVQYHSFAHTWKGYIVLINLFYIAAWTNHQLKTEYVIETVFTNKVETPFSSVNQEKYNDIFPLRWGSACNSRLEHSFKRAPEIYLEEEIAVCMMAYGGKPGFPVSSIDTNADHGSVDSSSSSNSNIRDNVNTQHLPSLVPRPIC